MGMMGEVYLDTILVPFSLFLTVGYHSYLWHSLKNKPLNTIIGVNSRTRRRWFLHLKEGDDPKNGVVALQSLRNNQMVSILTASIAIIISLALAALTNNAYKSSHLLKSKSFGSQLQSGSIYGLKYVSALIPMLISFLCSSLGLGFLIDTGVLLSLPSHTEAEAEAEVSYHTIGYTEMILERGFVMVFIGNRLLFLSFPLLLWTLGPLPVWLSSVLLIWGLYLMDFSSKFTSFNDQDLVN